ncbi:MAG: dienelactone hydrolase family protein [Pseudohongiellaceae bacterium]|nr:dienelactone hydrolase family protein [Pseudohongiellaceae bacterium]
MIKATSVVFLSLLATVHVFAQTEQLRVELADGKSIASFLLVPESATPAYLMVLMPPGDGSGALAYDVQASLGEEMRERGWAVSVPASPNNASFRNSNNALVIGLIDELQKDPRIATGKVILAGISNGGISAIEIASHYPDRVKAVLGVPAIVSSNTDLDALNGMPIYLRIGDQDEYMWMNRYDETKKQLEEAGVQLDADLLFMSPHTFGMDWENLDPWLSNIKEQLEAK